MAISVVISGNYHLMLPETELVLCACRIPVPPTAAERIKKLLTGPLDWDLVLSRSLDWQVEPVVLENLRIGYSTMIPAGTLRLLKMKETEARANSLARTLAMLELLPSFDAAGVRTIVLKGPAIGVLAYGDPSSRSFGDIDLLVRREDFETARVILRKRGFREMVAKPFRPGFFSEYHLAFTDGRTEVEVHYSLFSRKLGAQFDDDGVWRHSRTVACLNRSITVLGSEYLFLFLCAHGAKHEWKVFRWICDIAQLAQRLTSADVSCLVTLARQGHMSRILGLGIQLVQNTFGEEAITSLELRRLTDSYTNGLARVVGARLASEDVDGENGADPVADFHPYLFWARSRERRRDQAASLLKFFFVPTELDSRHPLLTPFLRSSRLLANTMKRLAARQR